jgi:cysteine-rich repeat protein
MKFTSRWSAALLVVPLLVSTAGPNPAQAQEICGDCLDNDTDGLVECYDPDCWLDAVVCGDVFQSGPVPAPECEPVIALSELWRAATGTDLAVPAVGDVDADGIPELVIWSGDSLQVVSGLDGSLEQSTSPVGGVSGQTPAIADVDGDGLGEIFLGSTQASAPFSYCLARYEHDLAETWTIPGGGDPNYKYAGPALADFDQDGSAEIYMMGRIFDARTGTLLVDASADINLMTSSNSLAADIFPDGFCPDCAGLELLASHGVYAVNLASGSFQAVSLHADMPRGTLALVDWDGDHELDMVINETTFIFAPGREQLSVWDPRLGASLTGVHVFETGSASLPAVGDFDGDGELEIAVRTSLDGFTPRVLRILDHDLSVQWDVLLTENSEWTSVTSFDFDCDGVPELVDRGDHTLAVVSGLDGSVLAQVGCSSGTNTERPIIVDVDADGDADIVAGCAEAGGFVAWEVPGSPPARRVNNQFSYFNVHINDDLTIPCLQQNHADDHLHPLLNGFLYQAPYFDQQGRACNQICWCGNGSLDVGEECDDANADPADQCAADCTLTYCGDGVLQSPNGRGAGGPANDGMEECDDGNSIPNDGCTDCVSVILAVDWLSFDAVCERAGVRLRWSVGQETGTLGYRVRRAAAAGPDGSLLGGTVMATGSYSRYQLLDGEADSAERWYRIEEVCLSSGGCTVSPWIEVDCLGAERLGAGSRQRDGELRSR